MGHYHITDYDGRTLAEFDGELVAEVTTDDGERARWIEMKLYRRSDGKGWLIHRLSDSVLYHREDTACRTPKNARPGQPATAADLDEGSEPCANCKPPQLRELPPDAAVRIEVPRHTVHLANTEQEVVDNLSIDRRTGSRFWSPPVVELLALAGAQHRAFFTLIPQTAVRP